jgi:hypothetical protein
MTYLEFFAISQQFILGDLAIPEFDIWPISTNQGVVPQPQH